jgi:hypothetical protein
MRPEIGLAIAVGLAYGTDNLPDGVAAEWCPGVAVSSRSCHSAVSADSNPITRHMTIRSTTRGCSQEKSFAHEAQSAALA